jgi:hypothetical protein
VKTRIEMSAAAADMAPFNRDMLAMDVVDTLRRQPELVAGDTAETIARLRALYRGAGIDAPDEAILDGIAAAGDGRFGYTAPKGSLPGLWLARLYVVRRSWLPATLTILAVLSIGFGSYFLLYRPYEDARVRQAQIEITQMMPATMDGLYETIHEETKVQQAENDALAIRDRGKAAAQKGDRPAAQAAIDDLTTMRDTLRAEYQLKIVDRPGTKWGFWTFPQNNAEATNYYLVVQAVDGDGNPLTLPVRSEDTGKVERVVIWGERVPEEVYNAAEADKSDDGTIQHDLIAIKQFGYLDPIYMVQTLGGQVTRW